MSQRPKIVLAFANTPEPAEHLRQLNAERKEIYDLIKDDQVPLEDRTLTEATLDSLEAEFDKFKADIQLFHFAGHADGEHIMMQGEDETLNPLFVQGLAELIGKYRAVRLAFLNACATKAQIRAFHDEGIAVVIATKAAVKDEVAQFFAVTFYEALTKHKSIREAYDEAKEKLSRRYLSTGFYRSEQVRDRVHKRNQNAHDPYVLSVAPDASGADQVTLTQLYDEHQRQQKQLVPDGKKRVAEQLYLKVNREDAADGFKACYRNRAEAAAQREDWVRYPRAFVIQGQDQDKPQSLAQRFATYTIKAALGIKLDRSPKNLHINLPNKKAVEAKNRKAWWKLDEAWKEVLSLEDREDPLTAQDLIAYAGRNQQVMFLQHSLFARDWCPAMGTFLQTYIEDFWQIPLAENQPEVFLLFHVWIPEPKGLFGGKGLEKKVAKGLEASIGQACTLLERLPLVEVADVKRWQKRYLLHADPIHPPLFGSQSTLPMQRVEKALINAIQQHNHDIT